MAARLVLHSPTFLLQTKPFFAKQSSTFQLPVNLGMTPSMMTQSNIYEEEIYTFHLIYFFAAPFKEVFIVFIDAFSFAPTPPLRRWKGGKAGTENRRRM